MCDTIKGLSLEQYRYPIHLDMPFNPTNSWPISKETYEASINVLVKGLLSEKQSGSQQEIPKEISHKRDLIKALLTIRAPKPIEASLEKHIDVILQYEKASHNVVRSVDLPDVQNQFGTADFPAQLCLWQGDITRLEVDAIVNAANAQMLGCFQPYHACIDNAIHSAAGPKLREDCAIIMDLQGDVEATGTAKITRAYHLPSDFILHTVGPIIPKGTKVTHEQRSLLASCYTCCLSLANEMNAIRSISFCGISTGVFGYPKQDAAEVAVQTVSKWLDANPGRFDRIIFNVYGEEDLKVYEESFRYR